MTDQEYIEFDSFLKKTRFDVKEIMSTKKRFKQVHELLYNYMKMGFEEERVRKHPVFFSFNEEKVLQMEIRHFIVNMLCWYPMIKIGRTEDLDEHFILDCSCLNSKDMQAYFNTVIVEPYRDYVSNEEMNLIFEDTIFRLSQISLDFNEIMAISIDIETFITLAESNADFDDVIHTKPRPGMQPVEIEAMTHKGMEKLINIMKNTDNALRPILNSGEGIKDKQLSEFAVMGGLKPDITGNTIPKPIDTNYIVGGLNSVGNFYVDKQAGRKAVVANKTLMGNAGFFAAKIMKVTKDTRLDMSVDDCHTNHPIYYFVKDLKHLAIIDKAFYSIYEDSELICSNGMKDTHLLGQHIYLRNPTTCGLDNNRVCKKCYGKMYKVNGHKQFGQGGFASAITANKYQQDTLSTKHLLTTNSVPIEFPEEFYKVFSLESNIIMIKPDEIEDPGRWSVIIAEERMVEYDQVEFNSHTSQLMLRDNRTKEKFIIEEKNDKEIFIYQDIINKFSHKGNQIELNIGSIEDETCLGIIIVENNELTKPLKNMQQLLDTKNHFGCETVDEMVNTMADLMIDAGMEKVLLVHSSMTLKNLVRQRDDIYASPKFSAFGEQNYILLKITDALVNSPSLTTGLASQELRKQFSDPSTYKKFGKASTDVYFRKSLMKK